MDRETLMRVILVAAAVLVAGCAAHYHKNMDKDMKALVGQNVGVAVDRLGYPSNKLTISGNTVYVWDANDCIIHIGTDAYDHIVRFDYDGSRRDCEKYYDALDEDRSPPPPPKTAQH
jgi:hypothetical protein